jgi:hypothetical protein
MAFGTILRKAPIIEAIFIGPGNERRIWIEIWIAPIFGMPLKNKIDPYPIF